MFRSNVDGGLDVATCVRTVVGGASTVEHGGLLGVVAGIVHAVTSQEEVDLGVLQAISAAHLTWRFIGRRPFPRL